MKLTKLITAALTATLTLGLASTAGAATSEPEPIHTFFLVPHPDDELRTMGTSIIHHNFSPDNDNRNNIVHLVLLSGGENSEAFEVANGDVVCPEHNVKHDPEAEGYAPFNREVFKEGTVNNFKHSAAMLGVTPDRVHTYDLGDGNIKAAEVKEVVRELLEKYPGSKFKAPSVYDYDEDHMTTAYALESLFKREEVTDVRYYVDNSMLHSGQYAQISRLPISQAPHSPQWDPYLRAATQTYEDWNPRKGYYHVGSVNDAEAFEFLKADPRTWYHLPQ